MMSSGLWSVLLYAALVLCNLNAVDCGKCYAHLKCSRIKVKEKNVGGPDAGLFMRIYVDHIITFCQPTTSRRHMPAVNLLKAKRLSIAPVSAIITSH